MSLSPAAQIGVEVRTVTPLTAQSGANQLSIPANTLLSSSQGIDAGYTSGACYSVASSSVTFSSTATSADVSFQNRAVSTSLMNQCGAGPSTVGSHTIRVSLTSPAPVSGHVLVSLSALASVSLNRSDASWTIDVGDDATPELSGMATQASTAFVERHAVLGTVPLGILITTRVFAGHPYQSQTNGFANFTIAFRPTPGRVSAIGSPCGPRLTGTLAQGGNLASFRLAAASTSQAQATYLIVGTQDLTVVLPPTACVLRTDPLLVAPVVVSNGAWSFTLPLATPFAATDVRAQFLEGLLVNNVPHWHLSEGIRLRLP